VNTSGTSGNQAKLWSWDRSERRNLRILGRLQGQRFYSIRRSRLILIAEQA